MSYAIKSSLLRVSWRPSRMTYLIEFGFTKDTNDREEMDELFSLVVIRSYTDSNNSGGDTRKPQTFLTI